MKHFLINLASFAIATVIIWLVLVGTCKLINNSFYKYTYSDHETLILGDSHVQFLNEKIMPESLNLYRGGQSYKESYFKLKYFDDLNDFDRVVLAFSYHNFSNLAEHKINQDYYSIHSISTISSLFELFKSTKSIENFFKVLFQLHNSAHLGLYYNQVLNKSTYLKSEVDNDIKYKKFYDIKTKKFPKEKCKKVIQQYSG